MKKLAVLFAFLALPAYLLVAYSVSETSTELTFQPQDDLQNCIEKIDSGFDRPCRDCKVSAGTYQVHLRNNCDQAVDLMCCVQNKYKRWRCFNKRDMGKDDVLISYDCKGTGKYLKWVRKAGDETVVFPTPIEVNEQYK